MSGLKGWLGNRNGIPASVQSPTNGASDTTIPAANNRRQLLAAQARMPPPQTRLARQPLHPSSDLAETRTNNSVVPSNVKSEEGPKAMAEQFDSQDQYGGAFDTDAEGMDETSILSEVQVKDSQAGGPDAAPTTTPWVTRQPEHEWNQAINQVNNDQQDAHMDIYEDVDAEGTEEGEVSGLEEDEEMSDEAFAPDDHTTVGSTSLARELRKMKADLDWRPLVERPKHRANVVHQPRQTIPKPTFRHYPEPNKQARGRALNGGGDTNNYHSNITSGESDPDDDNEDIAREKGQGSTTRQNGHHKVPKGPDSQPKVVRVPQVKQPHQMRPPATQQPREEVRDRSAKQEHPPNHQHSPETGLPSPNPDETSHPKDLKPDLPNTNNDNAPDPKPNAAPPPTTTLLPEHPTPPPTKRRLSLDYPPTTLHTIPYNDLRTQPFDHNPNPPPSPLPSPLLSAPLPSKLQHITTLPDADRSTFFATLPLAEWEDAGDWFVERFGELVLKMRDARKERRRVAGEFEEEVARREEFVRRSREGVEGEMRKMRRGGEDVLRSKGS